jgi:hypothetical protein
MLNQSFPNANTLGWERLAAKKLAVRSLYLCNHAQPDFIASSLFISNKSKSFLCFIRLQ